MPYKPPRTFCRCVEITTSIFYPNPSDLIQESPTLDLVNDCSRFVTRHFEIITTSSPHIYHSALVLTPRESIVRKLYASHAQPFVRVVRGVPALWDPNIAAATSRFRILGAVWSPCNRFIAIGPDSTTTIDPDNKTTVDILDSATLQLLKSLDFPRDVYPSSSAALAFSPDCHILTSLLRRYDRPGTESAFVVSWDLQTGGVVSSIEWQRPHNKAVWGAQIAHSTNGKIAAVLSKDRSSVIISIYDVFSGVYSHDIDYCLRTDQDLALGTPCVYKIWTHGESLRFATAGSTTITILEVGFAPGATPTEVDTVPGDTVHAWRKSNVESIEFHPTTYRLAFTRTGPESELLVWDPRASRSLLHLTDTKRFLHMTFSSDAHLFACSTIESEVCLWRESPTGYTLLGKLAPSIKGPFPCLSPNGESIITFGGTGIRLWHTKSSTTATSDILPLHQGSPHHTGGAFLLEFFPDRPLAVAARLKDQTVTVLDLKSGLLWLTIDTSTKVYGLRSIGNVVVVVGDEKVITWGLPGADSLSHGRMSVEQSIQTTRFRNVEGSRAFAASISLDFRYIAVMASGPVGRFLEVYCTSTGQTLRAGARGSALWFAPGGRDIWCATLHPQDSGLVYTIAQDTLDLTAVEPDIEHGPLACPWRSSRGYKVTNGGWILSPEEKRLLMLPPLLRSFKRCRVWNGKFLALLHGELAEPVIFELEP